MTFVPAPQGAGRLVAAGARCALALTLFLVGLGLSRRTLRSLGPRPLVQATALWLALASSTLAAISYGWVS